MANARRVLTLTITLGLAGCLVVIFTKTPQVDSAKAQSDRVSNQKKPSPDNNYGFSEEAPEGDWSAQSDIDTSQANDPNVPVVIAGARSYAGKGKWRKHVMIESVILKNHTDKAVKTVKFGWIIITEKDRKAYKNREAAVVQGLTPSFDTKLPAKGFTRIEALYIDVVKEARELIKNGALRRRFFLRIRINEAQFEDGSVWNENGPFAYWERKLAHAPSRRLQLPNCPNQKCLFYEDGQGHCDINDPFSGTICRRVFCSPDDPNACFCDERLCSQCKDLDGDAWYDCEGDCWDEANNVDAFNSHPGADEICNDGRDNDCDPSTPDGDGCIPSSPTPTPTPTPNSGGGGGGGNGDPSRNGCERPIDCQNWSYIACDCLPVTPVLVDTLGDGFAMTSATGGVMFDFDADGVAQRISWTAIASDDAWLVLDRNRNGTIDNGQELFGNFTPQSEPLNGEEKNGFLALAEYDRQDCSGNGDGKIDYRDAVFSWFRLWRDSNHNGISELSELHTLQELGLDTLDLKYKESKRTDEFGNLFRYRAQFKDAKGAQIGRWAWDVFLISGLP